VLIAVLNDIMAEAWTPYEPVAAEPLSARLLWVVHQLQQMSSLVSTVHARAERSPAITEWHNDFHFFTASLLRSELENAGASPAELDAEVMIGIFAIEGLLMHPWTRNNNARYARLSLHAGSRHQRYSPTPVRCNRRPNERLSLRGLQMTRSQNACHLLISDVTWMSLILEPCHYVDKDIVAGRYLGRCSLQIRRIGQADLSAWSPDLLSTLVCVCVCACVCVEVAAL
jgi:hypothetical protein